jgi:endonuclease YncB( thermonuclease family)
MLRPFIFIFSVLMLSACGAGDSSIPVTATSTIFCGVVTGSGRLTGTVTLVHDGDTLTVNGQSVRLNSIDAPELAQTYGTSSRDHLSALVMGQRVTITYARTDVYGRVLGTVFKSDCSNANLNQVAAGAAWYEEAYKCEIDAQQRSAFAAAQASAMLNLLGLWAGPALAPWIFRNGVDVKVPLACPNGDSPTL